MKRLITTFLILALAIGTSVSARAFVVSGKVSEISEDSGRLPVVGAMVLVKGSSTGSLTDADGRYSINVPEDAVLLFSSLGYEDLEVPVAGRAVIDVTMQLASEQLDELVFIGYGSVKKSDLVTSVASVSTDDLKLYPAATAAEMLKGKAAGVTVSMASGAPGSVPTITIRGSRSISASNTPLYIIDGSVASDNEFAMMSADDIASIEILKDAASQAIYGARASDGVILVTTKRGEEGQARISYNGYAGVQSLHRNFDLYNGDEWVELKKEIKAHDSNMIYADEVSVTDALSDAMMLEAYKNINYTDWESLMFKKAAFYQNHELSVRGGSDKLKTSASVGYYNQDGILKINSGYERLSGRVNIDYKARKWLTIGVNSSFGWTSRDLQNDAFYFFLTRSPLGQAYDADGNLLAYIDSRQDKNPIWQAEHEKHHTDATNYRINAFAEIKPFKGFSYRLNASYANRSVEEGQTKDSKYLGGGAVASISDDTVENKLLENIFNYTVPFKNDKHKLTVTAVQSVDSRLSRNLVLKTDNLPVDKNWNFVANGEVTEYGRKYSINNLVSFMGRAQYSYDSRYFLNVAMRRDGSSRFGAESKWGNFPSAAAAWRLDKEDFLKDVDKLDMLKLRVSYGIVGNQNGIDNYTTLGLVQQQEGEFGDVYVLGYLPGSQLSNPNLKWEQSATANIGLDFGLFDNRITGAVEYYRTHTTDLLVTRALNASLGYSSMLDNLGETRTSGVDFNLSADIIRSSELNLSTSLIFTHFKNRSAKIDDQVDENGKPLSQPGNAWIIGAPINIYYDYEKAGIYQYDDFEVFDNGDGTYSYLLYPTVDTDGDGIPDAELGRADVVYPGAIKVSDLNGDGIINEEDKRVYKRDPDFTLGWTTSLKWRGFDMSMDWFASVGGYVRNPLLYQEEYGGNLAGTTNGLKVDYWTPSNPTNGWPRPANVKKIQYLSTLGYQNASYLRLRTLQFGYSLPAKALKTCNIEKLRVYVTVTNLLTFTRVLSYSPEVMGNKYPETRQVVCGVNLTF
ncbi:MAG: TonB-dependent receptor [Bacteroidales bacterium]|nr:TonB-dependent receptor [Candidatus Cryptobacteroides aphodequi]